MPPKEEDEQDAWAPPRDAALLACVGLGAAAAADTHSVAWCPVAGLLAVGARQRADLAVVHLLSVHCPELKVALAVPLQGAHDELLHVGWSPAGCRRVLLAATRAGRVLAWTQQPPEASSSQQHITLEDWWCHEVADLSAAAAAGGAVDDGAVLLSARWLEPPPAWPWTPGRVLQQQDFEAGPISGMFAPPAAAQPPAPDDGSGGGAASAVKAEPGVKQEQGEPAGQQPSAGGDAPAAVPAAAAGGDFQFHWLQPGTLACVALLSSGHAVLLWARWAAYGQLQWDSSARIALLPPAADSADAPGAARALLLGDAAVSAGGVLVACVEQKQPAAIRVLQLEGNPRHLQCSQAEPGEPVVLPVRQLALHSDAPALGSSVTALSWQPGSLGRHLLSASSSSDGGGQLAMWALPEQEQQQALQAPDVGAPTQEQQPPQLQQLVKLSHIACAAAPRRQQLAWLLDGVVCGAGEQLQMYGLEPLAPGAVGFAPLPAHVRLPPHGSSRRTSSGSSAPPVLQAVAVSPHGVAVAAVVRCAAAATRGGSAARLLLFSVPPVLAVPAAAGSMAAVLAGRLLWALLQQRHSWDVTQHVLASAGAAHEAAAVARVARVLRLVDAKLAAQQATLRSTYAMRWDALKLALLAATPGDDARVVAMDLRLRMVSQLLKPVLEMLREEASNQKRGEPQARQRMAGLAPLQAYLAELMHFQLSCLKTWVHRRQAAAAAAGSGGGGDAAAAGAAPAAASAAHVPCIRHFLDWRSWNLSMLLYVMASTYVSGSKDERVYATLKLVMKAAPPCKDMPNWEAAAQALLPGPFRLHYGEAVPECLPSFSLPPQQLLAHMEPSAAWAELPVLSDPEISAAATRLGLLPARTPKAAAMYRCELQLHDAFRLQPAPEPAAAREAPQPAPAAAAGAGAGAGRGRLTAAKRRHWEQQLGLVMGEVLGPATMASSTVMDLAHLTQVDAGTPGLLQSVDGAMLAADAAPAPPGDARALPRGLQEQLSSGWTYAAPLTGELWSRAAGGSAAVGGWG